MRVRRGPSAVGDRTGRRPDVRVRAARLAVGTLTALVAIHQANVVHRDFKPSNVLLGADRPHVIDFILHRPDPPAPKRSAVVPAVDAALTKVVSPSTAKGGTLKLQQPSDFDSLDPGNMYYTGSWNLSRLYARSLLTSTAPRRGRRPAERGRPSPPRTWPRRSAWAASVSTCIRRTSPTCPSLDGSGVNDVLDRLTGTADRTTREKLTAELDRKVMDTAAVVPLVYDRVVLYRGIRFTNAALSQMYVGYDLTTLGIG